MAAALWTDYANFDQHVQEERAACMRTIDERLLELKVALGGARGPVGVLMAQTNCVSMWKKQKRRGWNDRNNFVDLPESVPDHTTGMRPIVRYVAKKRGLDVEKADNLAYYHDFQELLATDVNIYNYPEELRGAIKAMKHEIETYAKLHLVTLLNEIDPAEKLGDQVEAFIDEYEARATPEARLVKLADMLEVAIQAVSYDRDSKNRVDAEYFLEQVKPFLEEDELFFEAWQHLVQQLSNQRHARAA